MVPAHKKEGKQNLKNYRSVSLLPIAGEIFERKLHNNIITCMNSLQKII